MSTTSPTAPPRTIQIAFWLFLLTALAHLVGLIISAATSGSTTAAAKSQLAKAGGSAAATQQAQSFVGAGVAIAIVLGALFLIAFVVFDLFMRRGAGWARIVLLIITILSLTGIVGGYGTGAVGVVAAVVATVLMFLRPSSEYFQAVKARKYGNGGGVAGGPARV
ncbi:hypothetical protein [Frondihabitans peucedani]|uniref:Uncharacterized protein n=1 Tax=Frondihabitans peucedani TaxID=598626 RepID=A0ABP8E5U3_9MICO